MRKYCILITNDDGINSPALKIMGEKLSIFGDIYIIVPERERSGGSHAITLHKPLRINEINWSLEKVKVWSTNGNPADCVLLGLYAVLAQKPDLVISGINRGYNLGNDIIYSGTVSGAREASLNGIPAIAISVYQDGKEEDFKKATDLLIRLLDKFLKIIPEGTFLNINIPPNAKITDICLTYQGKFHYRNIVERRLDPRNKEYFWLHGYVEENGEEGSDIWAVKNGKISITPLQSDMTNYSLLNTLKSYDLL